MIRILEKVVHKENELKNDPKNDFLLKRAIHQKKEKKKIFD